MESPAGLVDAGEDGAKAAERELLEETGFSGKVACVSPIVPCDPGMTDANMRCVRFVLVFGCVHLRASSLMPRVLDVPVPFLFLGLCTGGHESFERAGSLRDCCVS